MEQEPVAVRREGVEELRSCGRQKRVAHTGERLYGRVHVSQPDMACHLRCMRSVSS